MSAAVLLASLPACAPNPDGGTGDTRTPPPAGDRVEHASRPGQAADPGTPRTPEDALALARAVLPEPADYGADFTPQDPYETDPATWPVLGDDCAWRRDPLPDHVLAALARSVQAPARQPDAPPLQVMAAVTVFDSPEAADAQMAEVLEEALRCPGQELRGGEFVADLTSSSPYDTVRQGDDSVYESGAFTTDAHPGAGPFPYLWNVVRHGTVLTALSVKGTEGYDESETTNVAAAALALMGTSVEGELAR